MMKLIDKKVKFNGMNGVVYDVTLDGKVWVETQEDIFVTTVENIEIIEPLKGSASIEFDTYTDDEGERTLTAFVTVKSEQAEKIHNLLSNIMLEYVDGEFWGCPTEDHNFYCDGMTFKYEHGFMTELKNDIKHAFKKAKKELGIR